MRFVTALFLFLMLLSGPADACQHDHGAETESITTHSAMDMTHDGHAMHMSMTTSGHMAHTPSSEEPNHCPPDCNGSMDCDACQVTLTATFIAHDARPVLGAQTSGVPISDRLSDRQDVSDPPPPKHLSL